MTAEEGPIAVLGLGLIGGSLARDLAAGGATVWGYDSDAATMRRARRAGVIAGIIGEDLARLSMARTIVLAVPVDVAPALLERARPHLGDATLITDVGSTKRRIVAHAMALGLARTFVGSHPMAGDQSAGWAASRRGLFAGARVDLCGDASVQPAVWRRARALWRRVGARPAVRCAIAHDKEVAFSSHLPQLLSLALADTFAARGISRQRLGAGGRDMTRLAGSDAAMWSAILDENAADVLDALDTCRATLGVLRAAVESHDREAVHDAFGVARRWMEAGEPRRARPRTAERMDP